MGVVDVAFPSPSRLPDPAAIGFRVSRAGGAGGSLPGGGLLAESPEGVAGGCGRFLCIS